MSNYQINSVIFVLSHPKETQMRTTEFFYGKLPSDSPGFLYSNSPYPMKPQNHY